MRDLHLVALAGMVALAASVGPAKAAFVPVELLGTIGVPADSANTQPGGAFTSFDISFTDPITGLDYVADRSNAAVDVFTGTSTFVGRTPSIFAGQQPTTALSGPDGVLTVNNSTQHTLFAGDVVNPSNPLTSAGVLRAFTIPSSGVPTTQTAFSPVNTGGSFRVDEMAYAPGPNLVLMANNADTPAFGTLVNATTGAIVASHITIPGQVGTGGLEQPVWDPKTGTFFISVPTFNGSDPGGVAEISTSGSVMRTFHFDTISGGSITSCSPTGLALGGSGNLMVGCGNAGTQTVLLNPAGNGGAGTIVQTFSQISGSDELWYDPTTGNFYVTGSSGGNRVFDIISDSGENILQSVSLGVPAGVNAHSIAVDALTGLIYLPLPGSTATVPDTVCPLGCVEVFGAAGAVPEPGSLPVLVVGMAGLIGLAVRRRLQ